MTGSPALPSSSKTLPEKLDGAPPELSGETSPHHQLESSPAGSPSFGKLLKSKQGTSIFSLSERSWPPNPAFSVVTR